MMIEKLCFKISNKVRNPDCLFLIFLEHRFEALFEDFQSVVGGVWTEALDCLINFLATNLP